MPRLLNLVLVFLLVGCSHQVSQDFSLDNFDCGATFTTNQFHLQSPNYPNEYDKNLTCEYILKGENCPTYYKFEFLDFNLENSLGCSKDRLEIGHLDALCGTKVGSKNYFAQDGDLNVKFISNDIEESKGFNILIARFPCNQDPNTINEIPDIFDQTEETSTQANPSLFHNGPNCCLDIYKEKRFMITNPGFPHGQDSPFDCLYKIQRANRNICRLRLHFNFYWNGVQEPQGCENGFLEIDSKRICGCRSGLKLISVFDERWNDKFKTIRYRNDGYANAFRGFAIEVIQDECPKRTERENYHFYEDRNNRISFPKEEYEKALLVREGILPFHQNQQRDESVVRHFYYFQPQTAFGQKTKDVEETTYEDTTSFNPFLPHGNDDYKCRMFGMMQWAVLAKQTLFKNMPKCDVHDGPNEQKCINLDLVKGHVQSVGYPFWYPKNINQCYRFIQKPAYCSIKLYMEDFDLQYSHQCKKDYVLFGNKYRYCGNRLFNTISTLVFEKSYEDFYFVSDNCFCGRGFKAWYEQIPCETPTIPTTPPTFPTTLPPTTPPLPACNREITDEYFDLEIYGYQESRCQFNIYKLNDEVCSLDLSYVAFDLDCNYEYLLIKGERYCGLLTGQTTSIQFGSTPLTIIYERNFLVDPSARRFRIQAQQNYRECIPDPEPSPDFIRRSSNNTDDFKKFDDVDMVKDGDQYKITLTNLNKDICGIIMNVESNNIEDICSMIENTRQNVLCKPIEGKTLYVPYKKNKIEINVVNKEAVDKISYKEIDCNHE